MNGADTGSGTRRKGVHVENDSAGNVPCGRGWAQGLDGRWFRDDDTPGAAAGSSPSPMGSHPELAPTVAGSQTPEPAWGSPASLTGETRFYAYLTIFVLPILLPVFAFVGVFATIHGSGPFPGWFFLAFSILLVIAGLRGPYVAIVEPDGSLTFKALTVSKTTNLTRITRVALRTGARGGSSWIFYFDGTSSSLGDFGGKALARFVVAHNPAVEHPAGRFGGF